MGTRPAAVLWPRTQAARCLPPQPSPHPTHTPPTTHTYPPTHLQDQPINTGFSYSDDPRDRCYDEACVSDDM